METYKNRIGRVASMALMLWVVSFSVSCDDSSTDPHNEHMAEIHFSFTPSPAVTGAEITLLFEVEVGGVHTSITNAACEIHNSNEVSLTEGEPGHYTGVHTFSQSGTYEIHFSYFHEGMTMEEEFSMAVN